MTNIIATRKTYFVFPTIRHHGFVEKGQNITSPHNCETYYDEATYINRITELGLNQPDDELNAHHGLETDNS